jgi:chemotaxis protein MotA
MEGSALATTQTALAELSFEQPKRREHFDLGLIAGIAIAFASTIAGIWFTGVSFKYFLQPTGVLIVLGGTLGVVLVTTPRHSILHSIRRVIELITVREPNRAEMIEEIIYYARAARRSGILSLEPLIAKSTHDDLRKALQLAVDVRNRVELQTVLDTELRMAERQGETDAKTLEVAGGFAPTIGIIGTVIGLIDVLRQFSNVQSVGYGIGTAFVSTIYGLALANLVLLPVAHRIRARVTENFEKQELIMEGVLAIVDSVHPALIQMRLKCFVRNAQ